MRTIIEFIKKFEPLNFGLGIWNIPLFIGVLIVLHLSVKLITKLLPLESQKQMKKKLNIIFWIIIFPVLVLMILKAFITNDYWVIFVLLILLVPKFTRIKSVDDIFNTYDNFVDKRINGK
jgi:hypothetical protein